MKIYNRSRFMSRVLGVSVLIISAIFAYLCVMADTGVEFVVFGFVVFSGLALSMSLLYAEK